MVDAEPLLYEEEDTEAAAVQLPAAKPVAVTGEKRRVEPEAEGEAAPAAAAAAAAVGGGGAVRAQNAKRRKKGTSRFVEMEAELSDEEGQGGGVSDDEEEPDAEDDAMLADLIEEVQEGQRDQHARNQVHKRWEEEQDMKDVRAILHGIKNGFNRNRAGPDEEDGTDLEARRRRAALFADSAPGDEIQVAVLPGQLELVEEEEEDAAGDEYSKLRHEARKRRQAAAGSSPGEGGGGGGGSGGGGFQAMVGLDHTANEVMALMSRGASQSLPAAPAPAVQHPARRLQEAGPGSGRFTVFGKDLTNVGSAEQQGSSFLGRTATASLHRAASGAASRSFVFGADTSNSAPVMDGSMDASAHPAGKPAAARPSSFAGLKSIIGRPGPAHGNGGSKKDSAPSLLHILGKAKASR